MTTNVIRQQLHEQIDRVPADILRQIADFVAFITRRTDKSEESPSEQARFESFAGVLEGVITTDELMEITRGE